MIEIIIESPKFFSHFDESAFFSWLHAIPETQSVDGKGHKVNIVFSSEHLGEVSLRELLGLFYRYSINMKQLAYFCDSKNENWFKNKNMFWFEQVFGNGSV
jgi:hypothetical protein